MTLGSADMRYARSLPWWLGQSLMWTVLIVALMVWGAGAAAEAWARDAVVAVGAPIVDAAAFLGQLLYALAGMLVLLGIFAGLPALLVVLLLGGCRR